VLASRNVLALTLSMLVAAKPPTVAVTFPPGAPWRRATLVIRTRTFAGPLPFSPIGGPDAEASVELVIDGGPRVALLENQGFKSEWPDFKAYQAANLTVDVSPAGDGFSWCPNPCRSRRLVWFIDGEVVACGHVDAGPRPSLRDFLLDSLVEVPTWGCSDLEAQAVPWLLKRATRAPDERLELTLAKWLVSHSSDDAPRREVISFLRSRLPGSPAGAVLLEAYEKSVRERGVGYALYDDLTRGLPGRPATPTLLVNPVLRSGQRPRGRIELWNPDTRVLLTGAEFDGELAGLTPPAGVRGTLVLKVPGATPRALPHRSVGHEGQVVLEPADRVLDLAVVSGVTPAVGVEVRVIDTQLIDLKERVIATGRTDTAGKLRLPGLSQNELRVEVRPRGGECDELGFRSLSSGGKLLEIRALDLARRPVVRSRLVHAVTGAPVPGVRLRVRPYNNPGDCAVREVTTGPGGEFVVTGLDPGRGWEWTADGRPIGSQALSDSEPLRLFPTY
jgi:hypothetical protein